MSEPHSPFAERLRSELVRAAQANQDANRPRPRFERALRPLAVVAIVLVAGAVFASLLYQQRSNADVLAIQEANGQLKVTLVQPTDQASEVAKELRARHIKATVVAQPVASPQVGHFLSAGSHGGDGFTPASSSDGTFATFTATITPGLELQLFLGRAARPGEAYTFAFDPFQTGGAFHCAGVWGEAAQAAAPIIERTFGSVLWQTSGGSPPSGNSLPAEDSAQYVVGALQRSDESVIVVLAPQVTAAMKETMPNTADC